jgi:hypothetical protein
MCELGKGLKATPESQMSLNGSVYAGVTALALMSSVLTFCVVDRLKSVASRPGITYSSVESYVTERGSAIFKMTFEKKNSFINNVCKIFFEAFRPDRQYIISVLGRLHLRDIISEKTMHTFIENFCATCQSPEFALICKIPEKGLGPLEESIPRHLAAGLEDLLARVSKSVAFTNGDQKLEGIEFDYYVIHINEQDIPFFDLLVNYVQFRGKMPPSVITYVANSVCVQHGFKKKLQKMAETLQDDSQHDMIQTKLKKMVENKYMLLNYILGHNCIGIKYLKNIHEVNFLASKVLKDFGKRIDQALAD